MNQQIAPIQQETGLKGLSNFLNGDAVKNKFKEMMGNRSATFVSSALTVINQNKSLHNASKESVYNTLLIAASLDLPINSNLGFAYIIPYNESYKDANGSWHKRQVAQFQMGYKGFKQLAIRSGQFKSLGAKPVFEGQKIEDDSFLGFHFEWSKKSSDKVIGYASHFALKAGYESTFFMSTEDAMKHGKKYSKTFTTGVWKDDFEKMALKTVSKLHLNSGEAPLSVEMQRAIRADQAIIKDAENEEFEYADNIHEPETSASLVNDAESKRLIDFIGDCKDIKLLEAVFPECTSEAEIAAYEAQFDKLTPKK
jgi:recombination protein RecT